MTNTSISNSSAKLASLAVFRELYDTQKDLYWIISQFIDDIIKRNQIHQFSATEITDRINNEFDFKLPDAVVKTALKRLDYLTKEYGTYTANLSGQQNELKLSTEKEVIKDNNDIIINDLFTFVERESNFILDSEKKKTITESFCSFLLNNSENNEYSDYISAFILNNKANIAFSKQLKTIKEGVILYSGFKFSNDIGNIGNWKTPLRIFLDTEILFHSAGYNGVVYQNIFDDFYSYVKSINRNSKNKLISLCYFEENSKEIDSYFYKAQNIIDGKDKLNPNSTAMAEILLGCSTKSDVIEKKANFYMGLKTMGIHVDDYNNYFTEANHKYNIIDNETLDSIKEDIDTAYAREHLKPLNYVNIRRKGNYFHNFENIGYIFLTGNYRTLKVSWHDLIKENGQVPLATSLDFLTNKFWFKLNKGFGEGSFPKTFDVITKAQIVLSSKLNHAIGQKYDALLSKYKNGDLNDEQASIIISELRLESKKPEQISEIDISGTLSKIHDIDLERYIEEKEFLKSKLTEHEAREHKLTSMLQQQKDLISNYEKKLQHVESENQQTKSQNIQTNISLNELRINGLKLELSKYDNKINKANTLVNSLYLIIKLVPFILLVVLFVFMGYLYLFKNSNFEIWHLALGIIPFLFNIVYGLIYEKSFNYLSSLRHLKNILKTKVYNAKNINLNEYDKMKEDIEVLELKNIRLEKENEQIYSSL
ncbi:MAG: hypothetical protein JJU35_12835 [Balneolales bacterium]|nr:hypothetical protein [Balneolales bacterium]